jgi:methionine-rich copper-binding protein CopC
MVGSRPRKRRLVSALACAFVALFSTLAWPASPAQAHNELKSSTPSAGARLAAAPQQIRLVFNQKVEPGFTTVTLKVADKPTMTLTAREEGPSVTADVPSSATGAQAAGGSAAWEVDYRVVSADGHPINGSISFGVASAGPPPTTTTVPSSTPPTPTPAASSAPPANVSATGGGRPTGEDQRPIPLMLLVGGVIVLAVGAAVWLTRAKAAQGPS